ncbi:MAG: GlsB/YeaQ/YmgE family stress response membrane protein [Myxococcota bacterium]
MLMGTKARQGILANVVVGVLGASIGGFLARLLFADERGNNGLVASFGVALVGACVLIAVWKVVARKVA